MRQAFRVFDIDGNGTIDANELKITMFNLGENLSDRDVKQMIKLADKNGDGKIDYEGYYCSFVYMRDFARLFAGDRVRTIVWPPYKALGLNERKCEVVG
jgi:EF-hand domain pair